MSDSKSQPRAERASPVATLLGRGSIYTVATAAQLSAGLIVLPFLTRLLPPAEMGVVAVCVVILSVVSVVGPLGLPVAAMRAFFREEDGPASALFLLRRCIAASVLIALIVDLTGPLWSEVFSDVGYSTPLRLAVWAGVPMAALSCAQSILRAEERAGRFVITAAISTLVAQSLGLGLVVATDGGASEYVAGLLIGYLAAATSACVWAGIGRPVDPRPKAGLTAASLRIGIPSVAHSLAIYFLGAGNRIVVEALEGVRAVGRYTVGYQVGVVVIAILLAYNNAWDPIIFGEREERRWRTLAETRAVLYRLATMMFASVALAAPLLLLIAAPSDYDTADLVPVTVIIAAAAVPMVSYMASFHVLVWEGRTGILAWSTPLAAIANLGLCLVLIPLWGITGAAVATTVAYAALAALVRRGAGRLAVVPGGSRALVTAALATAAVAAVSLLLPAEGWWVAVRGAMGAAVGLATLAYGFRELRAQRRSPAPDQEASLSTAPGELGL